MATFERVVRGEILLDLVEPPVELVGDLHVVAPRLGNDPDAHHRLTRLLQDRLFVLRTEIRETDVPETNRLLPVGLDDEVVELLRRGQPALGVDDELGLVSDDLAGREIDIFLVQRVHDVQGRQTVRREFRRVHPESHRVALLPLDLR